MTLTRRSLQTAIAVAGLSLTAAPANAGWNNVFEACCWDCNKRASNYQPSTCCPQPEKRVQYTQRTYYEPVTEYRAEKYVEPQNYTYKSYYWEPVTSYRYSSYYDPCSGQCQKVATPVQSYALREQCNSATRYVERTRTVPVTAYRPVTVTQPVVTYYMPPVVTRSSYSIPALPPGYVAPSTEMYRTNPPAATEERGGQENLIPKTNLPTDPQSLPRAMPGSGTSRVNTASRGPSRVIGEVVENDRFTPRAGAKVVFVNAANTATREYTTANEFGEFETKLPAGEWFVYLGKGNGKAAYHSKIAVLASRPRNLKVVSQ
ncbi:MAG TPA: hypothetical protein VGJ05_07805 [Fimbriiglobus sp.]